MGLNIGFSKNRVERSSSGIRLGSGGGTGLLPGDPNPARFEIVSVESFGSHVVATVRYPDARNFDGVKVAVYRATDAELRAAKWLDPHFSEKPGPLVPVARYEPTERGRALARLTATFLSHGDG